jgi:hypothetical protein
MSSINTATQAGITNRSPYVVNVRSNASLSRQFSVVQFKAAEAYVAELTARGIKARLTQLELQPHVI